LGCGSKAAGSQPREKTPGCCGLNCLEQPQKTALKKNARWLKRAVATRNKKRRKNAMWLKKAPWCVLSGRWPLAKKTPCGCCCGRRDLSKKAVKKSPFKVVIIIRKVKLR
jgi:hypothetical protein